MTIAFDLDRTIDQDPLMWAAIVAIMKDRGHECLLVTCRRGTADNKQIVRDFFWDYGIDIPQSKQYYTNLAPKKSFMENLGVKVDLWVDDDPGCVINGK